MTLLKNKNMKKQFIFLLLVIVVLSCNYDYKRINESDISDYQKTLLKENSFGKFYSVCKDYGAPSNDKCFLIVQKDNQYYKVNPNYWCAISNDSIFLFKVVSFELSEKGNWVWINKKNIEGKENIFLKYDTIPSIGIPENEAGVFHLENDSLKKIGELTTYKSLHDLPDIGFYYLSAPGLFYEKALSIKEIK